MDRLQFLFIFLKYNWQLLIAFSKDVALTLAAISSIWVGLNGLKTWKRQLQGNTEYVLAKGVLTALYELRGAIDLARNGFHIYYPDVPVEELNRLAPKQKQWLIISNGYKKRWDIITNADSKFKSSLIEVEVIWGLDLIAKIKPLTRLINELFRAINESCIDDLNHTFNPRQRSDDEREKIRKREKILYKSFDAEDEYMKRLETIVSDIENDLKPHIFKYHRPRRTQ